MKKNHVIAEKAAGRIAKGILGIQTKFTNVLAKVSMSWKTKQQWIFLYIVCLVFGGLSFVAIVQSFENSKNILQKPAAIQIPVRVPETKHLVIITEDEYNHVRAFKQSLDSISKRKLLARRPGLLDSLEMVEQLYYSQKK